MTAVLMLQPGLCEFIPHMLDVVTSEGPNSGQTIISPEGGAEIRVCLDPDQELVRQALQQSFLGSP